MVNLMPKENLRSLLIKDLSRVDHVQAESMPKNEIKTSLIFLKYAMIRRSFRNLFFYRILSHSFFKTHEGLRTIIWYISRLLITVDIPRTAKIGGGLSIEHPECILINAKCEIGEYVTIAQGVTIGGNIGKVKKGRESPRIGNNVLIGAGAKLLGPITVGDNCMIGANAVVLKDIPENSVAVGIPAKVVKKVEEPFIEIERRWLKQSEKKEF